MANYERFAAWQHCHALALAVYRETAKHFPQDERYGLTAQVRRSAFSAAANIVEGSARRGKKEFRHFLDIAVASLAEVQYTVQFASELGYLDEATTRHLASLCTTASKTTWGLLRSLN